MANIYFEKIYETNNNETRSFAFNVNADIYESGLAEVCTYIKDKHSHFKDVIDIFATALTAVKSCMPTCASIENKDEKSYLLEINPDESTVSVKIFNSDFDIERLVQNYTYAVGYLQSCLINAGTVWEGGAK